MVKSKHFINHVDGFYLLVFAVIFLIVFYLFGRFTSPDFPDKSSLKSLISPTDMAIKIDLESGYIKSIFSKDGKNYLTIDYIQFLNNSDGTCTLDSVSNRNIPKCNPNGYLVINANPLIRTLEISKKIVVDFSDFKSANLTWRNGLNLNSPFLRFDELTTIFDGRYEDISWLKDAIYQVQIENGLIVKIKYQYQP